MEWYYAWSGCSVSPHCDARRKLATQIFFFINDEDWPREWGGDILILDDEGHYKAHSGSTYDDLKIAASLDLRKNGSLLFKRAEHSWHGVKPLQSPNPRPIQRHGTIIPNAVLGGLHHPYCRI